MRHTHADTLHGLFDNREFPFYNPHEYTIFIFFLFHPIDEPITHATFTHQSCSHARLLTQLSMCLCVQWKFICISEGTGLFSGIISCLYYLYTDFYLCGGIRARYNSENNESEL